MGTERPKENRTEQLQNKYLNGRNDGHDSVLGWLPEPQDLVVKGKPMIVDEARRAKYQEQTKHTPNF